jgi:RHS repeat-associated protein
MIYGGYYDYQDIYNLNVGQNPSLSFTYYDLMDTGQNFPLNLTTTMTYSNLDTSTPGYYYRVYQATDNRYYNMTFRIVFKVGNPTRGDRIPQEHVHYNYSNDWEDQLISYGEIDYINGVPQTQATLQAYTYDDQGNPTHITNFVYEGTTYEYANLSWSGRELTKIQIYNDMGINEYTIDYQYNDQGYRTNQTITYDNGSKSIDYELVDDRVIYESGKEYNQNNLEINAYDIIYTYDYDGTLISFSYKDDTHASAEYFYLRNQQGDITHIINSSGITVVKYKYDAYGKMIDEYVRPGYQHIFDHNSYTYRGYRYDSIIELYYLNSRYYNPEVGRFINADGKVGAFGELNDINLFAYCVNNPINNIDSNGYKFKFGNILKSVATVAIVVTLTVAAVTVGGPVLIGAAIGACYGLATGKELIGSSGRVFWSGVGPEKAAEYATQVGGKTLEQTFVG